MKPYDLFPVIFNFVFLRYTNLLAFSQILPCRYQCSPIINTCYNYITNLKKILDILTKTYNLIRILNMRKSGIRILKLATVNAFTIARLMGAIALPFIYNYKDIPTCALWTICLFLTDAVDGFLARKLKISTFFGCAMDALSDKLLNTISFVLLGITYNIMILPLFMELCILAIIYNTYRQGGNIKSSIIGKIKTVILDFCVIASFLLLGLPKFNITNKNIYSLITNTDKYIFILGVITTIACFIAILDYSKKNYLVRKNPNRIKIKELPKNRKSFNEILNDAFNTEYYLLHKDEPIMRQFYKA